MISGRGSAPETRSAVQLYQLSIQTGELRTIPRAGTAGIYREGSAQRLGITVRCERIRNYGRIRLARYEHWRCRW